MTNEARDAQWRARTSRKAKERPAKRGAREEVPRPSKDAPHPTASCSLVPPQHYSTLPASLVTFAAGATKRESSAREALEAKGDTRSLRPASTQYPLEPSHFPLCRNPRPAALPPGSLSINPHVPLVNHRPPLLQQPLWRVRVGRGSRKQTKKVTLWVVD
ncbi:hypothetical protein BT69DRAFT_1354533 [Atractiella rhizophila]|nr:hypothetical protein BT69DRAFT_1354533 [Atractiella rhizophila]